MRQIIIKYQGECKRCGVTLEVGAAAMYEKSMGCFCIGHEPVEVEDIRAFRQAKADCKADKYEAWAAKRVTNAEAQLNSYPEIRHDLAFCTQPGHIPFRARMIKADDRAYASLNKARGMQARADSLRHVRVKGDAERVDQAKREANDAVLTVGSRVFDATFKDGVILAVFKKSYRIRFSSKVGDPNGCVIKRDKCYVRPVAN